MRRRALELADVVKAHSPTYLRERGERVSSAQHRVLRAITACRTAALGGHVDHCDRCGHEVVSYNSCRNRHCPKCQTRASAEWTSQRERDLLPVEYFHIVFTLPYELAIIALHNPKRVYGLLFQTVARTLQQIAKDPKYLGAEIGLLAVLHTWGQNLHHHPHIHCVVPGGGIACGQGEWLSCRQGFFAPVRVLSRLFRGKFLSGLKRLHAKEPLHFAGQIQHLNEAGALRRYLAPLYQKDWVVYSKPPFGGPHRVLKYLARYTHRVAISNSRLVGMDDSSVSFIWRDYTHGNRRRLLRLPALEFLRRFLLHVLPKGFMRIRAYGLLANRTRAQKLSVGRQLLSDQGVTLPHAEADSHGAGSSPAQHKCPKCGAGVMLIWLRFDPGFAPDHIARLDSS